MKDFDAWDMLTGVAEAARLAPSVPTSVDFTLICGFLGAGKTTLLTNLLAAPGERRIVALVNDFGDVNIDASLVKARSPTAIELTNGCACCSLSAGLARVLGELVSADEPPDAIVMEASGVADPFGILQVALSRPGVRLEAVVAVVDAETIARHAADPRLRPVLSKQISEADLLLLNKVDLVSVADMAEARRAVRSMVPDARIVNTTQAAVPADLLFGRDAFREGPSAVERSHDNPFRTWTWRSPEPLEVDRFRTFLEQMPGAVLRAKGFVTFSDEPSSVHLLQAVGRRWTLTPEPAKPFDGGAEIVFIGDLDEPELAALEQSLIAAANIDISSGIDKVEPILRPAAPRGRVHDAGGLV